MITADQLLLLASWGVIFFMCAIAYGFYVSWKYEGKRLKWNEIVQKEWRVIIVFGIILASALIVNLFFPAERAEPEGVMKWFIITASVLTMLTWFQFLRKADVFEKENILLLAGVLLGGMAAGIAACYVDGIYLANGFRFRHQLVNDFVYNTFRIGLRDEALKFLPVLLLMLFSRAINESYDYILYACISALGFSFIENLHHAESARLELIHSWIMYSVVAQMFFSSIVAYGIIVSKYRNKDGIPWQIIGFLGFLFLSAFAHGFFEYWAVNEYVSSYKILSAIFILGSLFIWTTIRNNALNNSEFFDDAIAIKTDVLQNYLVITLTSIFMFEYIAMAWRYGHAYANASFMFYGYDSICLITFFSVNTTRMKLIKGDWNPISFSLDTNYMDVGEFDNYEVEISACNYNPRIAHSLPLSGKIERRVAVEGTRHSNAWITNLHSPHPWDVAIKDKVIIELYSQKSIINSERKIMAKLFLFKSDYKPEADFFLRKNLRSMGWVMIRQIVQEL